MITMKTLHHKIDEFINGIEIDYSELSSAHYDSNPYGVEPQLAGGSGCWEADEDEVFEAQVNKVLEILDCDGVCAFLDEELDDLLDDDIDILERESIRYASAYLLSNRIDGFQYKVYITDSDAVAEPYCICDTEYKAEKEVTQLVEQGYINACYFKCK